MMKNLVFLILLIFCIHCKTETKEGCDVVSQNVSLSIDKNPNSKSVPVSYYNCEFVVLMPDSKDSFELKKILEDNKLVRIRIAELNPSVQLYTYPPITDTNPKPPLPPPPIIDFRVSINTIGLDWQGNPQTRFNLLNNPMFNRQNVNR